MVMSGSERRHSPSAFGSEIRSHREQRQTVIAPFREFVIPINLMPGVLHRLSLRVVRGAAQKFLTKETLRSTKIACEQKSIAATRKGVVNFRRGGQANMLTRDFPLSLSTKKSITVRHQ